ncbi:MAG: DUF3943 domain-containing protein [Acidobacteriota bacterium]
MDRPLIRYLSAAFLAVILAAAAAPPSQAAERPAFCPAASGAPGDGEAVPAAVAFSLAASPAAEGAGSKAAAAPAAMPKKWRRFFVQEGLVAAVSTVEYWLSYHDWIEDWQFELTFADQYKRFLTLQAVTFDSNAYLTNWIHVPGGAFYYQMARSNYLTWPESLLATFTCSAIYEYVSEWREVISINDMALTTFGGYSLGEAWFQIGDYFHHRKSPVLKILGLVNPVNEINQWLDRKNPASRVYQEPGWANMVFSVAGWHSAETGRQSYGAGRIDIETQLLRVPGYGRPGTFKKFLADTSLSELSIGLTLRQRRPEDDQLKAGTAEEVDIAARVVGLSWYRQSIDELGRGSAFSIGLGSALTYLRKRPAAYDARGVQVHIDPPPATPTDFRDKMTVAHMFGPVVDWTWFGRGIKVRAVADAYADFGMINAFAFNAYSGDHSIAGLKTTLSYYGYYYAYGGTTSARIDVNWGNLWVRGLVSGQAWGSWQGRDRYQDSVTNNVGASDTRTRYLLQAGWRLGAVPVRFFAGIEGIHRRGKIGTVSAASQETRTFAGLSCLF